MKDLNDKQLKTLALGILWIKSKPRKQVKKLWKKHFKK
jgi:hypothetical protein